MENLRIELLPGECPLFSRALVAPWRLLCLAAGLVVLCVGSHVMPSVDWDYPISFIMGVSAYVFAPWTFRTLVHHRWRWMPLAFFLSWLSLDGVYSLYWGLRGFDALQEFRSANVIFDLPLYFMMGLAMDVDFKRGETAAPGSAPGERHFTGKKLLHALVTALLMALFAWGILLTTGSFCFEIQ